MGEVKQFNMRVDEETVEKFRQFCESNNMTQSQGFDHIIQVLEYDQAKTAVPNRRSEIEEFEATVKSINALYLHSVEIGENAENLALEKFAGQLASKDRVISTLQERVDAAEAAEQAARDAITRAETAEHERDSAEKNAADKERINVMLSEQLSEQKAAVAERNSLLGENESYKDQIKDLKFQLQETERMLHDAEEKNAMKIELEVQKAARETEMAMQEKIRESDKEIARLQERCDQLQKQIDSM